LGTATFLPLSKIQGRLLSRDEESLLQEGAVIDSSLNLIKFEEKFRPIFSFIFGSTLVVKDLAAAEAVGIGFQNDVLVASLQQGHMYYMAVISDFNSHKDYPIHDEVDGELIPVVKEIVRQ
jgi:chromosome segregation ATPase